MYLANTAHLQFVALIFSFLAWIFIMASAGLNEWRLWHVANATAVASGVAWVGIWRACFYSHDLDEVENCRGFSVSDSFLPPELVAAQVMMMLAAVVGLIACMCGAYAIRLALFSVEDRRNIRPAFLLAGTLYLLTSVLSMVPLGWNINSILLNRPINFPPEYNLPAAPYAQYIGSAIAVGLMASIVHLLSAFTFFAYRYVRKSLRSEGLRHVVDPLHVPWAETTLANGNARGLDNPTFQQDEHL